MARKPYITFYTPIATLKFARVISPLEKEDEDPIYTASIILNEEQLTEVVGKLKPIWEHAKNAGAKGTFKLKQLEHGKPFRTSAIRQNSEESGVDEDGDAIYEPIEGEYVLKASTKTVINGKNKSIPVVDASGVDLKNLLASKDVDLGAETQVRLKVSATYYAFSEGKKTTYGILLYLAGVQVIDNLQLHTNEEEMEVVSEAKPLDLSALDALPAVSKRPSTGNSDDDIDIDDDELPF